MTFTIQNVKDSISRIKDWLMETILCDFFVLENVLNVSQFILQL